MLYDNIYKNERVSWQLILSTWMSDNANIFFCQYTTPLGCRPILLLSNKVISSSCRGNENVTLTLSWNVIPNAGGLPRVRGIGSTQVKLPNTYVQTGSNRF